MVEVNMTICLGCLGMKVRMWVVVLHFLGIKCYYMFFSIYTLFIYMIFFLILFNQVFSYTQ
jgi:hypothetical protein